MDALSSFAPGLNQVQGTVGNQGMQRLLRDAATAAGPAAAATRGGGHALSARERAIFEPRFGSDLGHVRVHTDEGAAAASERINAKAFTVGNDIYFNQGRYNPSSAQGNSLLAHELVHTFQQNGAAALGSPPEIPQRQPDDKTPPAASTTEYDGELEVVRYAIGARSSGKLSDGFVLSGAGGWSAVGLSATEFYVGPMTSDMGNFFYVYRFVSDAGATTHQFTRAAYLHGWDDPPEGEDLRNKLVAVTGGKPVEFKTTGLTPPGGQLAGKAAPRRSKAPAAVPDKDPTRPVPSKDPAVAGKQEPGWVAPTDGVVQAWMGRQIDDWHTAGSQALQYAQRTLAPSSSLAFWASLAGNVIWAFGGFASGGTAVAIGLIGIGIGALGTKIQDDKTKSESERIQAFVNGLLNGFNTARSQMNAAIITQATRAMATAEFQEAVAMKDTAAWQAVIARQTGLPVVPDINEARNRIEADIYRVYAREANIWVEHDIFNVETPNHPGTTAEHRNFSAPRLPKDVRARFAEIGLDWQRIDEFAVPHRHRDLTRRPGTIGAIEYRDTQHATDFPQGWTDADKKRFLKDVPGYLGREGNPPNTDRRPDTASPATYTLPYFRRAVRASQAARIPRAPAGPPLRRDRSRLPPCTTPGPAGRTSDRCSSGSPGRQSARDADRARHSARP